jgi:hypothetical protein
MNTDAMTRLRQGLHKHFGPGAAVFVDPVMWMAGLVAVDLLRLDSWLQKRNPDYGDDDSMRGFIRRQYGEQAEHFVEHWIQGEALNPNVSSQGAHHEQLHPGLLPPEKVADQSCTGAGCLRGRDECTTDRELQVGL